MGGREEASGEGILEFEIDHHEIIHLLIQQFLGLAVMMIFGGSLGKGLTDELKFPE